MPTSMQPVPEGTKRLYPPRMVVFQTPLADGTMLEMTGIATYEDKDSVVIVLPFKKMPDLYADDRVQTIIQNVLSQTFDRTRGMHSYIQAKVEKKYVIDSVEDPALQIVIDELEAEAADIAKYERLLKAGLVIGGSDVAN